MAGATSRTQSDRMETSAAGSNAATMFVGAFMLLLALVLGWALLTVWPQATVENGQTIWINLTEVRALLVAIISGALGSYVHSATSFSSFAGNRRLKPSWIWWFMLRPPIGAGLALMVYFVLRSGLLLDGPLGEVVSPFGIAAVCACIGLFSKQTVDKLKAISDTALNNDQDIERTDKL